MVSFGVAIHIVRVLPSLWRTLGRLLLIIFSTRNRHYGPLDFEVARLVTKVDRTRLIAAGLNIYISFDVLHKKSSTVNAASITPKLAANGQPLKSKLSGFCFSIGRNFV